MGRCGCCSNCIDVRKYVAEQRANTKLNKRKRDIRIRGKQNKVKCSNGIGSNYVRMNEVEILGSGVMGGALGHMEKTGKYRPQQLESYLPKELWGLINDKLCSICQLLQRSEESAKVANDILKDISAKAGTDEQKIVFESYRRKILKKYKRSNLK
mmetsp:Transcript_23367/g.67347  ORF Transcript_23367/g.67347 Transcript_23367/m.67347 type:complete len:155 (-) Transcript_23367:21-485(-)